MQPKKEFEEKKPKTQITCLEDLKEQENNPYSNQNQNSFPPQIGA